MTESMVLGVDVGGTHIRVALVSRAGVILERGKVPTEIHRGARHASMRIAAESRRLMDKASHHGASVVGLGIGVAGKIHRARGEVIFSPNLPAMNGYPLAMELRETLRVPVAMDNDANVFGVGESWLGSGRGIPNWIGVTLGTGVGGCLVLAGELWHGDDLGFAGEVGHMNVDPQGPPCACGLRGCLEAHSSAGALLRAVSEAARGDWLGCGPLYRRWMKGNLTAEGIYLSAREGDPLARELFRRMGWGLGIVLAGLFTVLGIRHAIIGGGVSAAWDAFAGPLRVTLEQYSSFLAPEEMVVERSALGDDAALLGAAKLAWRAAERGEG